MKVSNYEFKYSSTLARYSRGLLLLLLIFFSITLFSQTNLVPNPGFEVVVDCDLNPGSADKAVSWRIINSPIATPDLFHICSKNPAYTSPSGCNSVVPLSGEGMVGLVNLSYSAEERIYAQLLDNLPIDTDIYVSFATIPRAKCGISEFEFLCYSNTQSLAFSDLQFQSRVVALEMDSILDLTNDWVKLQTCYRATGKEKLVLLGNYKPTSQAMRDCGYVDTFSNFAYFYIDDIIVAPFNVLPDTLFICGDDILQVETKFFDVPLKWDDGLIGGSRTIDQPGVYTILGDLGECVLTDRVTIIKIQDNSETTNIFICDNETISLESPANAIWNNTDTSNTLIVSKPGIYEATLLTNCPQTKILFEVFTKDCNIQYSVPNVFSPNNDGNNDEVFFYFDSENEFAGELIVYDKWGAKVFYAINNNTSSILQWNGKFNGRPLESGIYVWVYNYHYAGDKIPRSLSGNISLIE